MNCAMCEYSKSVPGAGDQLLCTRFPPTVHLIPQQGLDGRVHPHPVSAFPVVSGQMSCGELQVRSAS
jgi:hypothetical protein